MARLKVVLTEEHLKLIKNFRIQKLNELNVKNGVEDWTDKYYGIDTYGLFHGSHLYEDMAQILGVADQVIKGTEEDVDGPKYPQELMEKFIELDEYILDNILEIEEIIHQFSWYYDKQKNKWTGGVKPGVYTCKDSEHIWKYKEFTGTN